MKIIAVGSGKGGVGKSTISVNLALAMAQSGKKIGLLDADIYGPSIPRMMGLINQKPALNSAGKIVPHERYGIKVMSIGFLVPEDSALIWRGPMLFKALDQLLKDVAWGDLDVLILDLPPGTGDIPLTLSQKTPLAGAIAVTTPQNISLTDCRKSIDMFRKLNVPVLGLIENMSFLDVEGSAPINLFPKGDLDNYIATEKIVKLAAIPFSPLVAQSAEIGMPIFEIDKNSKATSALKSAADKVLNLIFTQKNIEATL